MDNPKHIEESIELVESGHLSDLGVIDADSEEEEDELINCKQLQTTEKKNRCITS